MNGRWESETKGSWTAISCAPYLKAIGLWGNGSTWNGGGLFVSNREYWIHENPMDRLMRRPDKLTRVFSHEGRVTPSSEDPGVYYPRLMRDGWRVVETGEPNTQRNRIQAVTIFEKDVIDSWVLRKFAHATTDHSEGKGNYFDEHELVETLTGRVVDVSEWEWADYVRGRLLWSTRGAIFTGKVTVNGIDEERMLKDFNNMTFEPIKAPY
ncbi:MAG: hypothetical protein H6818_09500 [Phycisphaerales bacterium]|nr:hypothetical protein [Phycisphaerales bacterium]MCB9864112.1 hypothetical protein [Phycisphaerales bacterium]